jgi:hypothetical protein
MPPAGCPGEQKIPGFMNKFPGMDFIKIPNKPTPGSFNRAGIMVLQMLHVGRIRPESRAGDG